MRDEISLLWLQQSRQKLQAEMHVIFVALI